MTEEELWEIQKVYRHKSSADSLVIRRLLSHINELCRELKMVATLEGLLADLGSDKPNLDNLLRRLRCQQQALRAIDAKVSPSVEARFDSAVANGDNPGLELSLLMVIKGLARSGLSMEDYSEREPEDESND